MHLVSGKWTINLQNKSPEEQKRLMDNLSELINLGLTYTKPEYISDFNQRGQEISDDYYRNLRDQNAKRGPQREGEVGGSD